MYPPCMTDLKVTLYGHDQSTVGPYSNTLAYPRACRQWLEGSTLVLSQEAGTIRVVSDPAGISKSSDEP